MENQYNYYNSEEPQNDPFYNQQNPQPEERPKRRCQKRLL